MTIFYPNAHPEVTSVDGYVGNDVEEPGGETWANLIAGLGNSYFCAWDAQTTCRVSFTANANTDQWESLYRSIILFDTSSLPDICIITGAILSLYGKSKGDYLGTTPNINIYAAAPASNMGLVGADYTALGTTAYCDTPITYANWGTTGYNNFTLNAAGLAAISKTGITKIGVRNASYDVAGVAPSWSWPEGLYHYSGLWFYSADQGTSYKPKLIVNYTVRYAEGAVLKDIITLEALRNIEMMAQGRFYIDNEGKAKYESRFYRSLP